MLFERTLLTPFFFALLLLVLSQGSAHARDGFSYNFAAETLYDTNPLTRSDDGQIDTIYGGEASASLLFNHESALESLESELKLSRAEFNERDYNSNDISFFARGQKKIKQWLIKLNGSASLGTTRVATSDILGQSDVVIGDRTEFSLSPSVVYSYSERNNVGLNMNWQEIKYEDKTGLTDHRNYSFSPFLSRDLTALQTLSVALMYQGYEALDGSGVEVESVGSFVTWEYNFIRNLSFVASAGFLRTEFEGLGAADSSETNPIYSVELTHEGQASNTSFSLERRREGAADGSEMDLTSVDLRHVYEISPRWDLNFNAQYQDATQSAFSTQNLDSSYVGSVQTSYDISRNLQFTASYRYSHVSFANNAENATGNIIRAGIEYSLY